MDQDVYIITPDNETYIGRVCDLLKYEGVSQTNTDALLLTLRDVVDDLVFGDEQKNYAVFTIELR